MATLELRPMSPPIERDPEPELGAEEQQLRIDGVFLDDVRVAAHALRVLRADERRPGLAVIGRDVEIGRLVAEGVTIEGRVGGARRESTRLYPVHPAVLRQA